MSNIIPMTVPTRPDRSALEEFLPEIPVTPSSAPDAGVHISPSEIRLDPIGPQSSHDSTRGADSIASQSEVQLWPMIAAACVALGVSMLALSLFAKIGHF